MKERINQLAEQAGSTHKQNLGVYQFYTDELEKFAELIVRECTGILDKAAELPDDIGGNAYVRAGSKKIKQHFRVDE
jgi:hypothetical protein